MGAEGAGACVSGVGAGAEAGGTGAAVSGGGGAATGVTVLVLVDAAGGSFGWQWS